MNNYFVVNSSPTVGYLSASIVATAMLFSSHSMPVEKTEQLFIKSAPYLTSSEPSTHDQYSNIFSGEFIPTLDPLIDVITDIYANLLANQESLEPEFEQILHANLWDLYES